MFFNLGEVVLGRRCPVHYSSTPSGYLSYMLLGFPLRRVFLFGQIDYVVICRFAVTKSDWLPGPALCRFCCIAEPGHRTAGCRTQGAPGLASLTSLVCEVRVPEDSGAFAL